MFSLGVTGWGLKKLRPTYFNDCGAMGKVADNNWFGESTASIWVKELIAVDLVSLKGNGNVRTGCLYTSNSLPSDRKSLLAICGLLKFGRGDAVLKPTKCPLRMRNSGSGSFKLKLHLSPPRRVSAVTTPAINLPYCARYGISLTEMVSTESIGTLSPNAPVAGSDTS